MIISAQSAPHAISVEAIATIILFHLKTLFSPAARNSRQKNQEVLKRRIKKLMNDTGLCNAINFIAMFYLTRFWHECDLHDVDVDESTQFELLVVALVTSWKVHDDESSQHGLKVDDVSKVVFTVNATTGINAVLRREYSKNIIIHSKQKFILTIVPYFELTRLFERNYLSRIDTAHAIDQIPINLKTLKPDFLVTNLHNELVAKTRSSITIKGGEIVAKKLGVGEGEATFDDGLYASMVNVAVPETSVVTEQFMNGLQVHLLKDWKCGTAPYKHAGRYWLRLSAQVYLNKADFAKLAGIKCFPLNVFITNKS
ncbi:UNVERIFIED_CONTAM: hypothetical protein HDU68_012777 [Siphonaria sp. JEL0065]|nr:hypothetical protein HDU68_012777 [Siphonaria sp. JEL0065]